MASFIVLTPQLRNGLPDEDRAVFIRDGFIWLAFIFPVPWLLLQRLWLEAGLVLAATIAVSLIGSYTGHADMAAIITALLSLLVGLEASRWRHAKLERKGFEQRAVVDAANAGDAEIAYFYGDDFVAEQPSEPTARVDMPAQARGFKPVVGGMVGLVSHRGEN
ncbi:DUF2628 domain-containing protein [Phyllobacterium sp. SB3]|uniref:DUF2628 domain-containing protein n=1 Tax=Phyllobacterium sp. SB3 TaxID=3156073 RepID=UPI0032AFADBE